MNGEHGRWREFALHLADIADRIALRHFGGAVPAELKPDGSPVTAADEGIEAALRDEIEGGWPGHAILGEEQGGAVDPDVPTWVIDPVDATRNFVRGVPVFATLVAVVQHGRAVVGVASAPALGERWDAAEGLGTRRNGAAVAVSAIDRLADALVLHGGLGWFRTSAEHWERLGRVADVAGRTRGFGDFWMHLLVAGGMAEVAFERDLSLWDVAAPSCIVTEAGGRMTDWRGGSALAGGGDVLATNGRCHDTMMGLLSPLTQSTPHVE